MSKTLRKNLPIVLAVFLALTLVFLVGFTVSTQTAFASEDSLTGISETLTIAQLSDIHYFSLDYCYAHYIDENGDYQYVDKTSEEFVNSDFNLGTYGDTKLVTESGMILAMTINNFIAKAQEIIDRADTEGDTTLLDQIPDVLIATGDLSKNSERIALIDVANALRYLQNEMRELVGSKGVKYFENFQIFAMPGNHDLYNGSASVYDITEADGTPADGSEMITDTLDTKTFAQIFESLGFPTFDYKNDVENNFNASYTGGKSDDSYWSSDYTGGYVHSTLAKNFNITYKCDTLNAIYNKYIGGELITEADYIGIDSSTNILSYIVEFLDGDRAAAETKSIGYTLFMIDSSTREATEETICVALSNAEINGININNYKNYYYLSDDKKSYLPFTSVSQVRQAVQANKTIYYSTGVDHVTGGRVLDSTLDWMQSVIDELESSEQLANEKYASYLNDYCDTYLIATHHNFLPHFAMEDEIVKDFTHYNWEHLVKRLLSMNIRYGFSGHMHTSDMQNYSDASGNVFYDYQTGSSVSFASPTRYVEIDRKYTTNKFVAENVVSTLDILQELVPAPSTNITTAADWVEVDISGLTTDKEIFDALYASNPDYFTYCYNYNRLNGHTYNEYVTEDIYGRLVDRLLEKFISINTIDSLRVTLETFLLEDISEIEIVSTLGLDKYGAALNYIAQDIIDNVLYELDFNSITNYITGEKFNAENAIEFVKQIVDPFLELEFGQEGHKLSLKEIATNIIQKHNSGTELQGIDHLYNPELNVLEYDVYYAYALKDLCAQCSDGSLVETLLMTLLDPLLLQDNSLIKQLYEYNFDFSALQDKYNLSDAQTAQIKEVFQIIRDFLMLSDMNAEEFMSNFKLQTVLSTTLVYNLISGLLQDNFGIELEGDIIDFAEDFIGKYMTESLFENLGGYLEQIVVAFSTDETADIYPIADAIEKGYYTAEDVAGGKVEPIASVPVQLHFTVDGQLVAGYATVAGVQYTYVQGQLLPDSANIATAENGRLPNHFIAAFDNQNPQTSFDISFYTAEEVYAYIQIFDENGNFIAEATTLPNESGVKDTADNGSSYGYLLEDGHTLDKYSTSVTSSGITVQIDSLAVPAYVPLIDLGILCLTHGEVTYEKTIGGTDYEFTYGSDQRDGDPTNSVIFYNHNMITISGLNANTTYKYRVYGVTKGIANSEEVKYFSLTDYVYSVKADNSKADYSAPSTTLSADDVTFSLKTAIAAGSDEAFSFIAVADPQGTIQSNYNQTKDVFDAINASEELGDYSFIANAGDMTDNGKNFLQWSLALDTMVEYYANTTVFMTAGNHESGSNAFRNFLTQTAPDSQDITDGMYYSFTYGNVHMVVLNTNDSDSKNGLGETQLNWLIDDLKNDDSTWTIILLHKSLYSVGSHTNDPEVVKMREQLTPIFAQYGVDVVIQGHDHTYSSTNFINEQGVATPTSTNSEGYVINADGTMYMTIGTIGNKYYEYIGNSSFAGLMDDDRTIAQTLSNQQTFAYFAVDGDKLVIKDCNYNRETGEIEVFGELKISKELGTVANAVSEIKVNGEPLKLNSTVQVNFASRTATLNFGDYQNLIAEGNSIKFFNEDGKEVTELKAEMFQKSTDFDVVLITADGEKIVLGTITLERAHYEGCIAGISIAIIIVLLGAIAGIVVPVVLMKRKSSHGKNSDSDNAE